MGRDEIGKRLGVTADQVKASNSKNRHERIEASSDAVNAFSKPSDPALARASRCKHVAEILDGLSRSKFKSQSACDKAFELAVVNARFRPPNKTLLGGTAP